MQKNLEIIALNQDDVLSLNNTQCTRIELCQDMAKDGLSPSLDLLKECLEVTQIPIRVMLRFSSGFKSTPKEEELINTYIQELNLINHQYLQGVVVGYLDENNLINENIIKKIRETLAPKYDICFHKASDQIVNNKVELNKLFNLPIDCILTQGGTSKIEENIENIKNLKELGAKHNIEILLGGGISQNNIKQIKELNLSIHLGSYVREDKDFKNKIDIKLI